MNNGRKIFWGLYCILAAASLICYKVGVFDSFIVSGISVWSIVWSIVLLAFLINGILHRSFFVVFMSLAIILCIFDEPLGITALTPWYVILAAILLSIGFSMIFKKNHVTKYNKWNYGPNGKDSVVIDNDPNMGKETTENLEGERVFLKTTMGSSIKYIKSDNFQYAEIKNDFGSMKVYFDNAMIQPGVTPVINVSNAFGEVQLYVPRNWNVINRANASFGNVNEKNRGDKTTEEYTVELRGSVSFGNLMVFYI